MSSEKPPISNQISWVYADNLDTAHEFYTRILGFECTRDEGMARIYQTTDGACIGVCKAQGERVIEPRGGMISIVTDDVDAWYRHLYGRGMVIGDPPHRNQTFGIYTFFIEDPNGYIIEFQQFLKS